MRLTLRMRIRSFTALVILAFGIAACTQPAGASSAPGGGSAAPPASAAPAASPVTKDGY